jgi:signal transduction histidine kinase
MARVHTQLRVRDAHRLTVEKQRDLAVIELAGAAAHEINNPLEVVMARLELMRERMDTSNDFYEDVVKLNDVLERIADIVKKMGQVRRYQVRHYCSGVNILDLDGASE